MLLPVAVCLFDCCPFVLLQVRDEFRIDYDPARGGWGKRIQQEATAQLFSDAGIAEPVFFTHHQRAQGGDIPAAKRARMVNQPQAPAAAVQDNAAEAAAGDEAEEQAVVEPMSHDVDEHEEKQQDGDDDTAAVEDQLGHDVVQQHDEDAEHDAAGGDAVELDADDDAGEEHMQHDPDDADT